MHIPNGFLDIKTSVTTAVASGGTLAYAFRKLNDLTDDQIPKMGMVGAFIFASQMINIPIGPGTSGHLIGGVLAYLLLGHFEAMITMTAVVFVQALFFQDGGLVVLGANVLNMAIVPVMVAYLIEKLVKNRKRISVAFMAWSSVVLSALLVSIELAVSGTVTISQVLLPMIGWHVLIGIAEGVITMFAYIFIDEQLNQREFSHE